MKSVITWHQLNRFMDVKHSLQGKNEITFEIHLLNYNAILERVLYFLLVALSAGGRNWDDLEPIIISLCLKVEKLYTWEIIAAISSNSMTMEGCVHFITGKKYMIGRSLWAELGFYKKKHERFTKCMYSVFDILIHTSTFCTRCQHSKKRTNSVLNTF